ncbi:SDR family oxidoreductase [Ferruginibacter albus]|uniref:SDR family oxidoreductase n=1 Tax=Ferruginibacter albus TaxID=2875540 RepID=UPI001CC3D211|nr:SDR family NAD(P)-dependent oxidoreductase [Ferruginibacter albus]UAY50641.1 SDR family NAD(P)-dependent oxidoreductase [Ferruginibacter albus]
MKSSNNKILITGGATGIGLGLTERFIKENNTVIICGRRTEVLKAVTDKFPSVISKECDLSVEADRIELYKWIAKEHMDLNVLVNNAGIQNWMSVSDEGFYQKAADEISINVTAPVHLANLFVGLPSLNTIINVTSGLAFIPLSKVPVYCATKAFMRSFTLSLRHMLQEKNIEVIEMIPPALNTDLGAKGIHDAYPPVSDFVEAVFEQMKQGKKELTFGTSEARANANNEIIADYFNKMNP